MARAAGGPCPCGAAHRVGLAVFQQRNDLRLPEFGGRDAGIRAGDGGSGRGVPGGECRAVGGGADERRVLHVSAARRAGRGGRLRCRHLRARLRGGERFLPPRRRRGVGASAGLRRVRVPRRRGQFRSRYGSDPAGARPAGGALAGLSRPDRPARRARPGRSGTVCDHHGVVSRGRSAGGAAGRSRARRRRGQAYRGGRGARGGAPQFRVAGATSARRAIVVSGVAGPSARGAAGGGRRRRWSRCCARPGWGARRCITSWATTPISPRCSGGSACRSR